MPTIGLSLQCIKSPFLARSWPRKKSSRQTSWRSYTNS